MKKNILGIISRIIKINAFMFMLFLKRYISDKKTRIPRIPALDPPRKALNNSLERKNIKKNDPVNPIFLFVKISFITIE